MKTNILRLMIAAILVIAPFINEARGQQSNAENMTEQTISNDEKLVVVWTSGDRDVAIKMVFMYTFNAQKNGWWKDITLLIWGPSAKLMTEDQELQDYLHRMQEAGVHTIACKGCADSYGITDKLEALGVTVRYTGVELTNYIKENRHILNF